MADQHDFLILGSDPGRCALASRLTCSVAKLKLLLMKAGGKNSNIEYEIISDSFFTHATACTLGTIKRPEDQLFAGLVLVLLLREC